MVVVPSLRLAGARSGQASTEPVPSGAEGLRAGGARWELKVHPRLSWGIDPQGAHVASDGAVWFGGAVDPEPERGHLGGVLRFDPLQAGWTHYTPAEAPIHVYGIGETADGALWFGGSRLIRFDGRSWMDGLPKAEDRVYSNKGT